MVRRKDKLTRGWVEWVDNSCFKSDPHQPEEVLFVSQQVKADTIRSEMLNVKLQDLIL